MVTGFDPRGKSIGRTAETLSMFDRHAGVLEFLSARIEHATGHKLFTHKPCNKRLWDITTIGNTSRHGTLVVRAVKNGQSIDTYFVAERNSGHMEYDCDFVLMAS